MNNNTGAIHLLHQQPQPVGMQTYHILFDLDGTMADCAHRLHHLQKEPPDWKAFYDDCTLDLPLPAAVLYNILVRQSIMMIDCHAERPDAPVPLIDIVTSRPELYRGLTMRWMRDSGLMPPHDLFMRANNDFRPDQEVKLEIYKREYANKEVDIVFEDRDSVVKMWRDAGIPCFQVAAGNY